MQHLPVLRERDRDLGVLAHRRVPAIGGLLVTAAWSRMSRSPGSSTASVSILGIRGTCVATSVAMAQTVRLGSRGRQRPRAMRAMPRDMAAPCARVRRGTARPPHVSPGHRFGHDHRGRGRAAPRAVRRFAGPKRLEDELGLTLLERTPMGVMPTPAGADFARHAKTILAGVAAAESDMAAHRDSASGRVRVGFLTSVVPLLLAPLLRRLRARHLHIRAEFAEGLPLDLLARSVSGASTWPTWFPARHRRPRVGRAGRAAAGAHRRPRPPARGRPAGRARRPRPGTWVSFRSGGPSHTWIARAGAAGGFSPRIVTESETFAGSRRSCRPAPASRCCLRPPCARSRAATRCGRCPCTAACPPRRCGGPVAGPPAGAAGRRRHQGRRRPCPGRRAGCVLRLSRAGRGRAAARPRARRAGPAGGARPGRSRAGRRRRRCAGRPAA